MTRPMSLNGTKRANLRASPRLLGAAGIKVGQSPLQKLRSVQHPGATTETNCGNHLTEQKAPDVRCQFSGGRLNRPEILAKLINLQLSI